MKSTEGVAKWRRNHPERDKEHRDAYRRRLYRENRIKLDALKAVPCADCRGTFPPECMDFDHVRGTKSFGIATNLAKTWKTIAAEITKCEVVCSNCHRIRTRKRKAAPDAE